MNSAERQQLIDALIDNNISEADFIRLEAELTIDRAARREYYERIKLSLLLENMADDPASVNEAGVQLPIQGAGIVQRWKWAFSAMAIIAAALLIVVGLQFGSRSHHDNEPAHLQPRETLADNVENAVTGFAVISGQADAVWSNEESLANGSLVSTGELHLRSGVVRLELFSGVLLVVEGDATFSVISPMEVAVARGKVRARVPEPAQGFRLRTDAGEVVDLGTEFAVNVSDEGSEVHVLDGEIEWQPRGEIAQRMEQGEAVKRTIDGRSVAAGSSDFVGSNELQQRLEAKLNAGLLHWKASSELLRHDPRLVAYYQVTQDNLSTRRLPNLATRREETPASEGAIVAAASAQGRWGQPDSALEFSPAGSRVRLSVPGEHRSLTLLCWVKINSLDRWYNSLFLTDGHEEGEPHWQIMDDGRLFFSVKKRDVFDRAKGESDKHIYYSPSFWDSSLSGQWLMIATAYDVDAMKVTHFLNGETLSEETIPQEYLVESVRIGKASLCNWGLPERNQPRFAVRNLNGSLDEFALFDAALSKEEIRKLYDDGKP